MSYHLTIQRIGKGQPKITLEDFFNACKEEKNITIDVDKKTASVWEAEILEATIQISDGEIWTKNPEILNLMIRIAVKVGGYVVGDEGEIYNTDGTIQIEKSAGEKKQKFKKIFIWNIVRWLILLAGIILAILNHLKK